MTSINDCVELEEDYKTGAIVYDELTDTYGIVLCEPYSAPAFIDEYDEELDEYSVGEYEEEYVQVKWTLNEADKLTGNVLLPEKHVPLYRLNVVSKA